MSRADNRNSMNNTDTNNTVHMPIQQDNSVRCAKIKEANLHQYGIKLFAALAILFGVMTTAQAQPANIEDMQKLVQRWVIMEQQNTALTIDWQRQQQILQQRLQLLEEEKSQLNDIISSNATDTDEVTARRLNLLELQNTMENDQIQMQQTLQFAMGAILSLHTQLPPPLVLAWQEKLDSLPTATANDPATNSNTQLQALLDMLNQLQDFEQRINLHEDVITLADNSEVLVKQLYLGLSHAWYVSADGNIAGYGQSQTGGWVWLNEPQVDPATVQQAIAMLERNVDVQMVELPLVLQALPLSVTRVQTAATEVQ